MDNIELQSKYKILVFFKFDHLPVHLQAVSKPYSDLAYNLASTETEHFAEVAAGLRHLLEAKDCAVRCNVK